MRALTWFMRLPITWRVPLAVAMLMVAVSAVTSERVLNRLRTLQIVYLQSLATSYLDGITASISPSVLRQDSWEIFDALDRMKSENGDIVALETIVATTSNVILAASDPVERQTLDLLDTAFLDNFPAKGVNIDEGTARGYIKRDIVHQGRPIGKVLAVFDAAPLLKERREVLATLLLTNSALTGALVLVGFVAVRRMVRPIHVLENHMLEAADGRPAAISEDEYARTNQETRRVFQAFDALLRSESERGQLTRQLAEEEKLASLGRLASGMAHEINNPLGGLMNAVDTLRKHGEKASVRKTSLDLLQRGLQGISEVVQAALATYRPERLKRPLSVRDFEDVRLLLGLELRKRSQTLNIALSKFGDVPCNCPSGPVRQALLNLLLNASAATPNGGTISVTAERTDSRFMISVEDQGAGMPQESKEILTAGSTIKTPRASDGLGLWVVRRIADELGATLTVSENGQGGTVVSMDLAEAKEGSLEDAA
jgi:signal transduction histidine kinase